jgi:ADP-heptose:LPS heptosyltransferase
VKGETDFMQFFLCHLVGKKSGRTSQAGELNLSYDPRRILVLKARHGFGDNLMVTAVIEGLHRLYPELRIIVLAKHPEIFINNPHVYACFGIAEIAPNHPLTGWVIDMHYTDFVKRRAVKDDKSHYIDRLYNCLPIPVSLRHYVPRLFLTEDEQDYKRAELEKLPRPVVAVSPYGKSESSLLGKIYPKSRWDSVTGLLIASGVTIVQVGIKSEGPLLKGCVDWRDIGYRHTAAVLAYCDAVVTHVGGIMHLATACGVPCVALFGGIEDPDISGYRENKNICVSLECAPCWRKKLCRTKRCLELMSPQIIVKAAIDLMASSRNTDHKN